MMARASTTSLKLDHEVKKRVSAPRLRRSPHWLIREAIEEYVEREQRREQFRQTHSPFGIATKQPACMSPAKKSTSGWPNSERATVPLLRNAASEAVPTGAARLSPGLHEFLAPKSRDGAKRGESDPATRESARQAPGDGPSAGTDSLELREGVIEFGHGAYIALYLNDGKEIVTLAVGHRRETRY
jgi:hypothetical protein